MATKPSSSPPKRPFGQPTIAAKNARLDPFRGRAFRFYILMPRYRQSGEEVFSEDEANQVFRLLTFDFGGCTTNDVAKSPVIGSYEMRELGEPTLAVDIHTEFTVYTKPTRTCERYFERLEGNLRKHLWETRGIYEEQIMMEITEVKIIASKWRRKGA